MKPTDEELVRAAWGGDPVGLGLLLERYRVPLYATAIRLIRSRADADDAVQETFMVALRRLDQLSDPAAVGGWLHQVLRNVCWMRLRASRREIAEVDWLLDSSASSLEASIEEQIEHLALRDWIWGTLTQLPDTLRVTAMLRYFSRASSYAEIATILGVPVGTVRSRLNQVKVKLAEALLRDAEGGGGQINAVHRELETMYATALGGLSQRRGHELWMSTFASDLRVALPDGQVFGKPFWTEDAEEIMRAGVKIHLSNLMVSEDIIILETTSENPPDDPFHCPPGTTQIHFQRSSLTHRLHLYLHAAEKTG